jgi:2-desacetyl-2-hydroxyethyl bacteriochlorophyllide A dehydrogenase
VLARAIASGISQGTELLLYRGDGPTPFDPSLDPPGAPTYPRRYGYAWVGEVVTAGVDSGLTPRTRVFALAPHGDWQVLDAAAAHPLDPLIPPARAVLAASLETAITCVWDSGCSIGDDIVVLGGGVVGLLVAWLSASAGGRVILVEPSARRREVAQRLGVRAVAPGEDHPAGADVVFEATGDPGVLARAIEHAGQEATVIVASFYGTRTSPVPLGAEFHRRRLTLRASQVSAIPPSRRPRWNVGRRFALVSSLLKDPVLDALLDPIMPFDQAPAAYGRLAAAPGDALQVVFGYA